MVNRPPDIPDNQSKVSSKRFKVSGVIVLTVLILCVVFFAAKGLFSSNDMDIPADVYTGTINTDITSKTVKTTKSEDSKGSSSTAKKSDDSSANSSQSDSSISEDGEKAYVTEYANLHTEPSKDSENIVCMSPNVEVTVLEKLDNGYWKIYFVNIDGPKTGYLWSGYLQSEPLN